jgi:hypothetical protein
MLGLNTEEGECEGLDESGRELLQDLKAEVRENPKSSGNAGLEAGFSSLTIEADQEGETVRFNKGGQWFGAPISGSTRAGESIGDELRRCFDALKGKPPPLIPAYIQKHYPPTACLSHCTLPISPCFYLPCLFSYPPTPFTRLISVLPHHLERRWRYLFLLGVEYVWKLSDLMIVQKQMPCPNDKERALVEWIGRHYMFKD